MLMPAREVISMLPAGGALQVLVHVGVHEDLHPRRGGAGGRGEGEPGHGGGELEVDVAAAGVQDVDLLGHGAPVAETAPEQHVLLGGRHSWAPGISLPTGRAMMPLSETEYMML